MKRRQFLKLASASAGIGLLSQSDWGLASESTTELNTVLVFLRGGADGLNMVVPFRDPHYYALRPDIAVPPPGENSGAIQLDDQFGLHPSMQPLQEIFDRGDLAFIQAAGGRHGSRSHFDAQSLMERGVNDKTGAFSGWLGRYAETLSDAFSTTFHQVSMGTTINLSLQGSAPAMAVSTLDSFDLILPDASANEMKEILAAAYAGNSAIAVAGQQALNALAQIEAAAPSQFSPQAEYPGTPFGRAMMETAQLLKSSLGCHLMTLNLGGWDHHDDENRQLPPLLTELSGSLSAFYKDMGSLMQNTRVIVISEFGRRASQNGSGGCDHGSANCMMVVGGKVRGGKVYGEWPGLANDSLDNGDLAITTDYRQVLLEVLLSENPALDVERLFPGYLPGQPLGLFS